MELSVHGRNLDVTPRLEDYVEKKVERLDRYLSTINQVRVDLAVENTRSNSDSQVAQFTVISRRTILRAEARTDDIFASIDAGIDKLHRQIERYKGKHYRGRGDGRSAAEVVEEEWPVDETGELLPLIAKRKKYILQIRYLLINFVRQRIVRIRCYCCR